MGILALCILGRETQRQQQASDRDETERQKNRERDERRMRLRAKRDKHMGRTGRQSKAIPSEKLTTLGEFNGDEYKAGDARVSQIIVLTAAFS